MAYLGMGYAEARSITLYEYNARITGYAEAEERQWHRIRVLASILLQPHAKRGRPIRPTDLIPLPGDVKHPEGKRMSADAVRADLEMKLKAFRMN